MDGHPDEKLIAAQCLASLNVTTSDVIHEILKNYFNAEDELTREQLMMALAKLSQQTVRSISILYEKSEYSLLIFRLLCIV